MGALCIQVQADLGDMLKGVWVGAGAGVGVGMGVGVGVGGGVDMLKGFLQRCGAPPNAPRSRPASFRLLGFRTFATLQFQGICIVSMLFRAVGLLGFYPPQSPTPKPWPLTPSP